MMYASGDSVFHIVDEYSRGLRRQRTRCGLLLPQAQVFRTVRTSRMTICGSCERRTKPGMAAGRWMTTVPPKNGVPFIALYDDEPYVIRWSNRTHDRRSGWVLCGWCDFMIFREESPQAWALISHLYGKLLDPAARERS